MHWLSCCAAYSFVHRDRHPTKCAILAVVLLASLALVIGCLMFIGNLLRDNGKNWSFVIPGSLFLVLGGSAAMMARIVSEGSVNGTEFGIVVIIAGAILALWYNIKAVGIADGVVVTTVEACFAIICLAMIIIAMQARSDRRRSKR